MDFLLFISSTICNLAVVAFFWLSVLVALHFFSAAPRKIVVVARLAIPTFVTGLLLRLLAPWGPLVGSGRDLGYIDQVLLGQATSHAQLLASTYSFLSAFPDPLSGLVLGQLVLGAACCSLIAILTYSLCGREIPSLFAGLLAGILAVLIRVDASPTALVPLRFYFLLTLIMAHRYKKTGYLPALGATVFGIVALAYSRLEGPLLGALVLVWLAMYPTERSESQPAHVRDNKPGLPVIGVTLCLAMLTGLIGRVYLLPFAFLIAALLWYRSRGRFSLRRLLIAAGGIALLILPRMLLILSLERETWSRFPLAFLYLFGKSNILFFDPQLCTPFVLVFLAFGLWHARKAMPSLSKYIVCVAIPVFVFYLLFMGDTSARMKLQSVGILLLLPAAGVGAGVLIHHLARYWKHEVLWSILFSLVIVGASAPLSLGILGEPSTLQQEYNFWLSLRGHLPEGTKVYSPQKSEEMSMIEIPRVIQDKLGIRVQQIGLSDQLPKEPASIVYLGIGCRRYREVQPLPAYNKSAAELLFYDNDSRPRWRLYLKLAWNKQELFNEFFDELDIKEKPVCERLRKQLDLEPYLVMPAVRSRLESRLVPGKPFSFGLFKVGKCPQGG
jgi:hypothetical protein